ncbi:DUF4185 domain-containing protein [Actinoplanes sp. NPDC049118]|uniref:DUF4185 domain-containing protein n=1 Tax=Actinoplanes sp. NPDC049118 TaxID=3155769 RepID=UPI0033F80E64
MDGTADVPRALVLPTTEKGEFYAVADGTVENGELKMFYHRMRRCGTETLDVELVGTALATFAMPSPRPASVVDLPVDAAVSWGSALLPDGNHTYVYGTSSAPGRMRFAHLARAAAGDLGGAWQFWTGSQWSPDQAASAPILSGVGTTYSVQRIGAGYVLATQENNLLFDPQIVAYPAASPTGPFDAPRHLYTVPGIEAGSDTVVHDARLHPERSRAGRLLLSYHVSSLRAGGPRADSPQFVEVDWPLPAPPDHPPAPSGLTVTAAADETADLSWNAVPGATGYWVYQRDVTAGQTHFARRRSAVTAVTYRAGLLIPGHRYEFRIATAAEDIEGPAGTAVTATPHSTRPVTDVIRFAGTPDAVADSYIISLRRGAVPVEQVERFGRQLLAQHGGTFGDSFAATLHGFGATMTEPEARDLASHPDVDCIEQNHYVYLD